MCPFLKRSVLLACLACHSLVQAQIITDGSSGPQVVLDSPDVLISEALGTRSGANLLHSFQTFNITPGGSATFTGTDGIDHVISRVTGGEVSTIEGLLRSEIGNADFYLVNPAGVVIGEGGAIDVPASLHITTADEVRFTDGGSLNATDSQSSILTLGVPEQFGFSTGGAGSIRVVGGDVFIGTSSVSADTLSLSASELTLQQAGIQTPGNLYLAAVADGVSQLDLSNGVATSSTGAIEVTDSLIGAGPLGLPDNIVVQGGPLTIVESSALSGLVSESTGQLNIDVSSLDLNRGLVASRGEINLDVAGELRITDAGVISSSNSNGPRDIERANNFLEFSLSRYADVLESNGRGGSGDINVNVGELFIEGPANSITGITSQLGLDATGDSGNIDVNVSGNATILETGQISTVTESAGAAGQVTFSASELLVEHTDVGNSGGLFSDTRSSGRAGDVSVTIAEDASINGRISSSTFADGNAGNITLSTNNLFMRQISEEGSGIFSDASLGTGSAGIIDVNVTEKATLDAGGAISTTTTGTGDGGFIRFTAGELMINGARDTSTGIFSEAFDFVEDSGDAGDIEVTVAGSVSLQRGGQISTSTYDSGNAGSISVDASVLIIQHDGGADELLDETGIFSEAAGLPFRQEPVIPSGKAGAIDVGVANAMSILNGGQISSNNEGTGEAGAVVIKSPMGSIRIGGDSAISSSSIQLESNSGFIDIETGGSLTVDRSTISTQSLGGLARQISLGAGTLDTRGAQITTTTNSPTADGGNISLQSEVFVIRETIIQANADSGTGGEIVVDSMALIPFANQLSTGLTRRINVDDPQIATVGNVIQAVAENGVSIPPTLNTPELDISAVLSSVDSNVSNLPTIADDPCAVVQSAAPGSLVSLGRGSLPQRQPSSSQLLKDETVLLDKDTKESLERELTGSFTTLETQRLHCG